MIVLVTDIGEWVSVRILFLRIPTAFLGSRETTYVCSFWAMDQSQIRIRDFLENPDSFYIAFLGSREIAYLCLQRLGYGSESNTDKRKIL